ncbi:MAG TPA: sulfotransferase [Opitutaceae bacterium]|jgi:hypothetical protein|nr:sulfotransferase [Opitutaceae bacterium]
MASAPRPVFVLACYRSGTTLLRYLLDAHPRLACPPETKFISGLQAFADYPQALAGLRSLGYSEEEVLREVRRTIETFLGGYAARAGKPRWVDKTPSYHRQIDFLEKVFAREAQYVLMVRHPLDCVDSLGRLFPVEYAEAFNPDLGQKVREHGAGREGWIRFWTEIYARLDALRQAAPERTHVLRYEELVADPEAALRPLLRFLGEEYDPAMLAKAFTMEHAPGFQDSAIRKTDRVHEQSVGRWKQWPAAEAEAAWEIAGPTAAKFGYARPRE